MAAFRLYFGSSYVTPVPVIRIAQTPLSRPGESLKGYHRTVKMSFDLVSGSWTTELSALQSLFATSGQALEIYDGVKGGGGTLKLSLLSTSGILKTGHPIVTEQPALPAELAEQQLADAFGVRGVTVTVEGDYIVDSPSRTAVGQYTTRTNIGPDGSVMVTVSGRYAGSGAVDAAADRLLSGANYKLVSYDLSVDSDVAEVTFAYQYLNTTGSRTAVSFEETVTYIPSTWIEVQYPLADGTFSAVYQTCKDQARVVQSGSAVGLSAYPSFPSDVVGSPTRRKTNRQLKGPPQRLSDNSLRNYPISWEYEFWLDSDPGSCPTPKTS